MKGFISQSIYITLLTFSFNALLSQNRVELEEQRSQLIKEIESTSQDLSKTKNDKSKTIEEYSLLEDQIESRSELIDNLNSALDEVNTNLKNNQNQLDSLEVKFQILNDNYSEFLRVQLRKKILNKPWLSLLSSGSLQELFTNWRYLQQYEDYFDERSKQYNSTFTEIQEINDTLSQNLSSKKELLDLESQQAENLEKERNRKNELLRKLSASELALQSKLNKQKKQRIILNEAIEEIIAKEILAASKSASGASVSGLFSNYKGKLQWPVSGKISSWFGKQDHPEFKNVHIENNGIDISAAPSSDVKSIFEGKVVAVSFVPGHQNMVMIQHGTFFTVYSKLEKVFVAPGNEIETGEILGALNNSENAVLHFEIWQGKNKQNPADWIKL